MSATSDRFHGELLICLLLVVLPVSGQGQSQVIRNVTPAAWQAEEIDWIRDQDPRNKIDDLIDDSTLTEFDIVVNFKRCPVATDIDLLEQLGDVSMICRYITTVAVDDVSVDDVPTIADLPQVAFVELQAGFGTTLDVSVENIKVAAGFYSPSTVEDFDPTLDGSGVNIVIMDSGVDNNHEAFSQTPFIAGYDAVNGLEVDPNDLLGHGTHVASIALGQATNNISRGVAPAAGLIDVRVVDACDPNDRCCFWSAAVDGLETTYENRDLWGVDIINMSFEQCYQQNPVPSDGKDAFCQLIDLATSMGIIVVASAGNDFAEGFMAAPGAATRAITVAAYNDAGTETRSDDVMTLFSNRGPRPDDGDEDCLDELKPEIAAPGENIFAARGNTIDEGEELSGTSMAAPHVAGLCALIVEQRPDINPGSVRELLLSTADPRGGVSAPECDPIWNTAWGWGAVCGYSAVATRDITDLTFPSYPWEPHWKSPDISTSSPPQPDNPVTVTVEIENRGLNAAEDVRVNLGVHVYSAAIPTFHDIGTQIVDVIQVGQTEAVLFPWTPTDPGHQCLKAEIEYGPDTDYSNNKAQRNIKVTSGPQALQGSPVEFEVRNTISEAPAVIDLVPTLGGTSDDWQVVIDPLVLTMGAEDCPQAVSVELIPPGDAEPGDSAFVDVVALAEQQTGDIELGGVTLVHFVEDPSDAPELETSSPAADPHLAAIPNPTTHGATLSFSAPLGGPTTLTIYDVSGRLVRTLVDAVLEPSTSLHEVIWDRRNDRGEPAGSGVYVYRLRTAGGDATAKGIIVP